MKKYYMLTTLTDGNYLFGEENRTYANVFKVCEYNNKDVVIVVSDDDEYLKSCSEFMSDNSYEFAIKFPTAAQRMSMYSVGSILYSYDEWTELGKPNSLIYNPINLADNNVDNTEA